MKRFTYTITDPLGIHARPAGLLARTAMTFRDTVVTIEKDGASAKASQMMKLMGLGIRMGDAVTVTAEGAEEAAAIGAMEAFFRGNL